uniref:F-box/LRR-repeat protein At3g59200-like n=1 Tax=Erigeron canadensis TaxID=72917 RepID=UPI001CB8E013|nr:F-box/LRR-repeat protein At3g59200-like [Erigeron canadensis]
MNSVLDEDVVDTDRLSSLPLDLIRHILSLMDMKYSVQTCVLSSKWKHIWTSLRHIKLSTSEFEELGQFIRFTRHVIARRDNQLDVSSLELTFDGTLSQILLKVLLNYVVSHSVHQLTIYTSERDRKIPICMFESQSLKHLTMMNIHEDYCIVPQYPWDLPNLTTLNLYQIVLSDARSANRGSLDIFSKCINLKILNLTECFMAAVKVFIVSAPRLERVSIKKCQVNKIFISAPNLTAFDYTGEYPLTLSTIGLRHLDKVDLYLHVPTPHSSFKEEDARRLVKLLQEFQSAKFLNLEACAIESLFLYPDILSQPSPFHNLKHLNIVFQKEEIKFTVPNHVRNYFQQSSPSVTIATKVLKRIYA